MAHHDGPGAVRDPVELRREVQDLVLRLADHCGVRTRTAVAALDLTGGQAAALREMGDSPTMRQLADRLGCEPSNVTFVVDRLERRDLLRRRPDPADRRTRRIVLTASGRRLRERVLVALDGANPLGPLDEAELLRLSGVLRPLLEPGAGGPGGRDGEVPAGA